MELMKQRVLNKLEVVEVETAPLEVAEDLMDLVVVGVVDILMDPLQ